MMVCNSGFERERSRAEEPQHDKNNQLGKTSITSHKEDGAHSKRPKSSPACDVNKSKKPPPVRSKTAEGSQANEKSKAHDISRLPVKAHGKYDKEDCISIDSKKTTYTMSGSQKSNVALRGEKGKVSHSSLEGSIHSQSGELCDSQKKLKDDKTKRNTSSKKMSEIPKLKPNAKSNGTATSGGKTTSSQQQSKLPVKTKDFEDKHFESKSETDHSKPESVRLALKSYRVKREAKLDEKIKEAMKDDFSFLVPLYESEFRKITEVWVNTLYCSLTMRTNLVKLLYQAFPQINHDHFKTEEDTLLHYITHAKDKTKSEADSLLQLIRSLQGNRDKVKEQYANGMANREIAQLYNHDWKILSRKIFDAGEETKQLQMEVPDLQRKKEVYETAQCNKIRDMEINLEKKEAQIKKLMSQLDVLKEKESTYKKNVFLKIQDYKDVKAEVVSLKSMEKEFQDVKERFVSQNEVYEKKIKDLESLLQEKKRVLEKEREVKEKLQIFLNHLQSASVDRDHVDYVLKTTFPSKDKRKEQLWTAAVRLVLRGFLIQLKKLEKDRNKMLLELQSNDTENFNALAASLFKRDNFIKSIKQQMNDFQKAFPRSNVKMLDSQCMESYLHEDLVADA